MAERGWRFPPAADPVRGRVLTASYEEMLRQSVRMIITTRRGERFLHPEFGCDVYSFLFQPMDYTTLKQIENEITRSIKAWETRIRSLKVTAKADPEQLNRVQVEIAYFVPALGAEIQQNYTLPEVDAYESQ